MFKKHKKIDILLNKDLKLVLGNCKHPNYLFGLKLLNQSRSSSEMMLSVAGGIYLRLNAAVSYCNAFLLLDHDLTLSERLNFPH